MNGRTSSQNPRKRGKSTITTTTSHFTANTYTVSLEDPIGVRNQRITGKSDCFGTCPLMLELACHWTFEDFFNLSVVQAYAPASGYGDNEIEEFYDQLQNVIDQTPKKDILVVQGDWNAKVGKDVFENWQGICGPFCNDNANERGLRLQDFATFNDLGLANTFGYHKASRGWTWHRPNLQHHNQIEYILMRKRFWSGVNSARTRSFPGADIGSDHDLPMMTFHFRLKRISKPKH